MVECNLPSSPGCLRNFCIGFGLFCSLFEKQKWDKRRTKRSLCSGGTGWLKWIGPLVGVHPNSLSFRQLLFCALLCDRRRCQDQITMAFGKRDVLVPFVLCDPHGGVSSGRVAKICGAMAARTRHLCMMTKFPVRRQSYGSSSCQNSETC